MGKLVGNYIQQLRQRQGTSIRKLSSQVDLSPAHLSLLERGQREASIHTLYPLIKALGGNFRLALNLLAQDAGVPEEELSRKL
jgi:transcriptional regulator with XRE-family HTH domain